MHGRLTACSLLALISPEWNVNKGAEDDALRRAFALISPEWNVNKTMSRDRGEKISALISPEWNVNFVILIWYIKMIPL